MSVVARSCPAGACRPLRLLPAACGMMSRRRRAPRRSLSPGACAGRAGTHTGQHGHRIQCAGWAWRTCRGWAACSSCSCCSRWAVRAARRGDRAARAWRRAGRAGRACWACSRACSPPRTLAKNVGGEVLSTAGVVHSGSPARCVHAGSTRFLVCAASRRHARASLTLAAWGSQRSQSSLVLDETPAMPAARTTHHRAQPRLLGPLRALSAHS